MRLFRRQAKENRHHGVLRAVAGWCLQYPDDSVLGKTALLRAALNEIADVPGRAELLRVLDHLDGPSPGEHYVEVFDRKPRRTLHLTWYTDGDTRRRGSSLAELRQFYREHGFEPAENELPDFLPVVLEFAAAADSGTADELLARFRPGLELLHRNLIKLGTPYQDAIAAVLATIAAAAQPPVPQPPRELVGLDPYPTGSAR